MTNRGTVERKHTPLRSPCSLRGRVKCRDTGWVSASRSRAHVACLAAHRLAAHAHAPPESPGGGGRARARSAISPLFGRDAAAGFASRCSHAVSGRSLEALWSSQTLCVAQPGALTWRGRKRHRSGFCLGTNTALALLALADGNGQPRPLLRGWAHLGVLLYGTRCLLTHRSPFGPLAPPALAFTATTLLGYLGSITFHLIPWSTLRAYQLALCFDFLCITAAFSGQIAALVGLRHPAALASTAVSVAVLALCVAGLASGSVMWEYRRHSRKLLMLTQVILSSAVEARVIAHKPSAAIIALVKVGAFHWFAAFARFDAPRSSGLVWRGVWADHDNFHVIACVTHALQIRAAATQTVW